MLPAAVPTTLARLAGSTSVNQGRLEVYKDGTWAAVAAASNPAGLAGVACRQLGFSTGVAIRASIFHPFGRTPQWSTWDCAGTEDSLLGCPTTGNLMQDPSYDWNVACSSEPGVPLGQTRRGDFGVKRSVRLPMLSESVRPEHMTD